MMMTNNMIKYLLVLTLTIILMFPVVQGDLIVVKTSLFYPIVNHSCINCIVQSVYHQKINASIIDQDNVVIAQCSSTGKCQIKTYLDPVGYYRWVITNPNPTGTPNLPVETTIYYCNYNHFHIGLIIAVVMIVAISIVSLCYMVYQNKRDHPYEILPG